MYHHLTDVSQCLVMNQIVGGVIAPVPGSLVVHQHVDFRRTRRFLDRQRIFEAHRQRFFHHHVYAVTSADLHNPAMIVGVRINQNGLRMRLRDHVFQVGE